MAECSEPKVKKKGGNRCIPPGCTSGYGSNPNTYSVFSVPKGETNVKIWQKAINRDDIVLRPGHKVCERHFAEDDILRKKEFKAPDGKVIGVGKYERPRLRTGAIPIKFPGCPKYLSKPEPKKRLSPKKREAESPIGNAAKKVSHSKQTDDAISGNALEIDAIDHDDLIPKTTGNELFGKIFSNDRSVNFPCAWTRQNVPARKIGSTDRSMVQFSQWFSSTVGNEDLTYSKRILLKENSELRIFITGNLLDLEKFGIETKISSIENLEDTIRLLEGFKYCMGCPHSESFSSSINTSACFNDKEDFLRNKKCPLLLPLNFDGECCKFCDNVKKTSCPTGHHLG